MKRIDEEEANKILSDLIKLRKKSKRSGSLEDIEAYKKCEQLCSQKFDYLVTSKLYKYKSFANYEDLKQDGRMALVLALRNFNPKKGSFFWWANQYINTKVKREANRHSTIKIPIKKTKEYQPYKVSQLPILIDTDPTALQSMENDELVKMVQLAISKLPEDQRKIIELNGIKAYSISQISRELKLARVDCAKLLLEAKKNLKHNLEVTNL